MPEPDDIIARALGYPYPRPPHSYLFCGGGAKELPPESDFAGRVPVLACGSNGSPAQLQRKYEKFPQTSIPVTAATLRDVVCVYSAHFTGYGSVAAALCAAPGARSFVHLNWLTADQLTRMHETEAVGQNYRYVEIPGLNLHCSENGNMQSVFAYVSLRGSLLLDGAPVALGGIDCVDAPFPILDQREIQRRLRDILAPGMDLYDFIRQNVSDARLRAERTALLDRHAQAFDHPGMKILLE